MTLTEWRLKSLPRLRTLTPDVCRYPQVTLVIYTFPPPGREAEAFAGIECSVLRTWEILGRMPTVVVSDRRFAELDAFLARWNGLVRLCLSPLLRPGDIRSLSLDCITRLADYFDTDFCLVIQDDGFPLRDGLGEFLGKYDYIGAPANVGWRRKFLFRPLGLMTFNGGFSLRTHRLCAAAAREWARWGRRVIRLEGRLFAEDVFYTTTARFNPFYRFRFRFPSLTESLRFAYDDLSNLQDLPPPSAPFGFHGKTTAGRYLT